MIIALFHLHINHQYNRYIRGNCIAGLDFAWISQFDINDRFDLTASAQAVQ